MKRHSVAALLASLSLIALPSALLTGCGGQAIVEDNNSLLATELEKKDLENYISVSGSVEGSNIVHVTTELTAKVASVNVELGSKVKEGDILCTFDSTDLQEQYDKLAAAAEKTESQKSRQHTKNLKALNEANADKNSAIARAQNAVDRAVSARDNAQSQLDGYRSELNQLSSSIDSMYNAIAAGDDTLSEAYDAAVEQHNKLGEVIAELQESVYDLDAAVEDARNAYDQTIRSCDASIESAQEALDNEDFLEEDDTQKELKELQKQIDSCVVKATCSGVITALNIAEGSFATTNSLMTIEDTDVLRINVSISESDILNVHEGQKAIIHTNATGETEFTGEVSHVVNILSQSSDPYSGVSGGYSAEITIDKNEATLLIGMNAKVKLILDEEKDVFAVPYDAIKEDEDGKHTIFLAEQEGSKYKVNEIPVEVGLETSYFTEVKSKVLSEGDIVITEIDGISDGDVIDDVEIGSKDSKEDAEDADF